MSLREEGAETRVYNPSKFSWCKICGRRFYSSQALGGHQNAHKRERGLLRSLRQARSLAVKPHGHASKPAAGGASPPRQPCVAACPTPGVVWLGSFRSDDQGAGDMSASTSSTSGMQLDLNLKL